MSKNTSYVIIALTLVVVLLGAIIGDLYSKRKDYQSLENKYDDLNEKHRALEETYILELDQKKSEVNELINSNDELTETVKALQGELKINKVINNSKADYDLTRLLVGFWHIGDNVGSTSRNSFHLFEDGTFVSSNDGHPFTLYGSSRTLWSVGTWKVQNGLLYISLYRDYYFQGGQMAVDSIQGVYFEGATIKKREFDDVKVIIYPVLENDYDSGDSRISKTFGDTKLYKLNINPNLYLESYYELSTQLN